MRKCFIHIINKTYPIAKKKADESAYYQHLINSTKFMSLLSMQCAMSRMVKSKFKSWEPW